MPSALCLEFFSLNIQIHYFCHSRLPFSLDLPLYHKDILSSISNNGGSSFPSVSLLEALLTFLFLPAFLLWHINNYLRGHRFSLPWLPILYYASASLAESTSIFFPTVHLKQPRLFKNHAPQNSSSLCHFSIPKLLSHH